MNLKNLRVVVIAIVCIAVICGGFFLFSQNLNQGNKDELTELTSFYAVQIMSVAKLLKSDDPQLKGLKAEPYRPAGSSAYKYIIGKFKTREQASAELKKIKAKFPQAFIIYVDKK